MSSKGVESWLYGGWVGVLKFFRAQESLPPPRFGRSHRILRQMPEQFWKICGRIEDSWTKISVCFSASIYLHSCKSYREPYFLTSPRNSSFLIRRLLFSTVVSIYGVGFLYLSIL
jgi:hypothetical protein